MRTPVWFAAEPEQAVTTDRFSIAVQLGGFPQVVGPVLNELIQRSHGVFLVIARGFDRDEVALVAGRPDVAADHDGRQDEVERSLRRRDVEALGGAAHHVVDQRHEGRDVRGKPDDDRGTIYAVTDKRTGGSWALPNAEQGCSRG